MVDLALLRELIRNETARGDDDDIDTVFAHACSDCLFGSILVRASLPYRPVDIALPFSLMGVKKIRALSRSGTAVRKFPERYTVRLDRPVNLDFVPTALCWTFEVTPTRLNCPRDLTSLPL